jgi:hypothetical protein
MILRGLVALAGGTVQNPHEPEAQWSAKAAPIRSDGAGKT